MLKAFRLLTTHFETKNVLVVCPRHVLNFHERLSAAFPFPCKKRCRVSVESIPFVQFVVNAVKAVKRPLRKILSKHLKFQGTHDQHEAKKLGMVYGYSSERYLGISVICGRSDAQ